MDLRGATATVGDGPALPVLDVEHEPGESVDTGVIQLDGDTVTDLDTPAPAGTRIVFAGS